MSEGLAERSVDVFLSNAIFITLNAGSTTVVVVIIIIISILIAGSKFCDRNSSETAASLMLWLYMPISGGPTFCDS